MRERICFAVLLQTEISVAVLGLQSKTRGRSRASATGTGGSLQQPGFPLPRGFIPFQAVVLVTVGFFFFFFFFVKEK